MEWCLGSWGGRGNCYQSIAGSVGQVRQVRRSSQLLPFPILPESCCHRLQPYESGEHAAVFPGVSNIQIGDKLAIGQMNTSSEPIEGWRAIFLGVTPTPGHILAFA